MGDPTAVMGKRLVAGTLDYILLPFGLAAATAVATIDLTEVERCSTAANNCIEWTVDGTTDFYLVDGPIWLVYVVAFVVWLLNLVVLQGLTGASLGKLIFGLRVVDESGRTAGFGKVLARSLLWIVDGIGCVVPLVGPITALATKGHRRVGDLAAKTNVVGTVSVGQPPMPGAVSSAAYAASIPAPGSGAPPAPGEAWGTSPPAPAATAGAAPGGAAASEPQWDPARNTYVQWDAAGQRWMAYDQEAGEWQPLS